MYALHVCCPKDFEYPKNIMLEGTKTKDLLELLSPQRAHATEEIFLLLKPGHYDILVPRRKLRPRPENLESLKESLKRDK